MKTQTLSKECAEKMINDCVNNQRKADLQEWLECLKPISHKVRMIDSTVDATLIYHQLLDKITELKKELEELK